MRGREGVSIRTFVRVFYAFFDGVGGFSKDGLPDLGVDGHESGQETDLALGSL